MTLNCIFVVAFRIFIIQFSHNANKIVTVVVIVNILFHVFFIVFVTIMSIELTIV